MRKTVFFKKLNKKGFTFVECVCAIALFAIIGTMAFSMFTNSTRYVNSAKAEDEKQTAAQQMFKEDNFAKLYLNNDDIVRRSFKNPGTEPAVMPELCYAKLLYNTNYGDVEILVPVTPTGDTDTRSDGKEFEYYKTTDGRRIKVLNQQSADGE